MQITEKQLQHMVNFLTHKANYKVGLFLDEDEDGKNDVVGHDYDQDGKYDKVEPIKVNL